MARKIDPNCHANKLTVLRSRYILESIIRNHDRRRELLYDIMHQERINDDLEYLEMSITRTDVDDNPIPIAFDQQTLKTTGDDTSWVTP